MALATRRRTRIAIGLLATLLLLALWDGQRWRQVAGHNALIEAAAGGALLPAEIGAGLQELPPELSFAQAHALDNRGQLEPALKQYRALQGDDSPLALRARYNGARLLLLQAAQLQSSSQPGQAIALIELAKESLREVLRSDPGFWDARYNLERAQRLLPDPDDGDGQPPGAPSAAERSATTMRGYSPGLP